MDVLSNFFISKLEEARLFNVEPMKIKTMYEETRWLVKIR